MKKMKSTIFKMISVAAVLFLSAGTAAIAAEQLTIKGSTTVLPVTQKAAEAFMEEYPHINVSISGGGSGNGIKAIVDGTTDIAQSSRWIKQQEVELAVDNGFYPVPFGVALDAIIPVVHKDNPVNDLSLDQLKAIYEGKVRNWKEVGGEDLPITVISRDSSSGTFVVWNDVVLRGGRVSPRSQLLPSNGAITQAVVGNRNAIGYIGIGYLDDSLKSIRVDGVQPTHENAASGEYPVSRTLYYFTDGWPEGKQLLFINYMLHPEKGQKLVKEVGYIPLY
ncbi:MAG: phosphate ABC transporter substrate-binding protein [Desulfosalsimonadaceae bacterium]